MIGAGREARIGILEPSRARHERLAAWYDAEYQPLLRFAYFLTADAAEAEDLVQETFVRLHRAGERVYDEGFRPYARQTLLNLRRSSLRSAFRERRAFTRIHVEGAGGDPAETGAGTDVRRALMGLTVRQRACLALRFYEDLHVRDIAETLGLSEEAVRKHIQRGLDRMRSALGEENPG